MSDETPVRWAHVFIDVPDPRPAQEFWAAVTGRRVGEPWPGHPEFVSLVSERGDSYVHVQRIDGPPRVHIDLSVDDIDVQRDRLAALGATIGDRHEHWQTMASPGGLPFCLCRFRQERAPGPVVWPGGQRSRVAQVCIDAPMDLVDVERAFWERATLWRPKASARPEFGHLIPPEGQPLRLLVQRLGADDPTRTTRAHIDLGTDDVAAESKRLRNVGAVLIDDTHSFTVFRDPSGLPFCATPQPPD